MISSRHLVDPALLAALDAFPAFTMNPETLAATRASREELAALTPSPASDDLAVDNITIAGPDGNEVPILICRPTNAAAPMPAMLHIHGGGYVMGSADMSLAGNAATALALGCVIASVDYRLAPETCFPGPLEDCYAALKWLHSQADTLGVDRARIAIGGESAGGGLAAALAILARDRGEVPLIFQRLIYPMIDDRTCTTDRGAHIGEFVWTPESNRFGWASYLGREPGGEDVPPLAAPSRTEDLSGLPPAFISVGALDLFLDENIEFARRLLAAGVPTEFHIYPGAFHGFELDPASAPAQRAQRDRLEALARAFAA